jgi:hypothetical protein
VLYGIEARLKVCLHGVRRRAGCIQNGVVCIEVDQRITSSKIDIIDIYRVVPRIEPCGTPIETARGPDNRPSDLTH